jgi:hypothetical protein
MSDLKRVWVPFTNRIYVKGMAGSTNYSNLNEELVLFKMQYIKRQFDVYRKKDLTFTSRVWTKSQSR